ncbi:MAG: peptidase T [Hydrotalea flava]|uniref:peptidase T n=1 Tax=Hydrotalea TaxID=1004300 RepID=UPI00094573F7|nr:MULTISPECIES: peptidase T [Hydrotalea]MBY0348628.1 peptidase T [Hydrotalea flava]NIM36578.1 peptidase T [Hydrotalea flava]NIM39438.1 peptidase T [Hydrotalea flava]NIN04627.1 peptidase T [Hydrotalea flava]NIN16299.1 peptidase T [Hydrotalea flava]
MLKDYSYSVVERFMRYVQIDTQSDPAITNFPSTEKQKQLAQLLAAELKQMGIDDAKMDEYGYVYGTIPSNSPQKNIPVICFCAHMDTSSDCSGTNVKPILHQQYNGAPIVLPDDDTQVLTVDNYPYLKEHIGKDIITASGNTLLGADDKAGVAIIMDTANYLMQYPEIKHGDIKILFTPDEEVGRGTEKVNLQYLGADYGYTLDGGEAGHLEVETFSADSVTITIYGVSAHPGYAKNKLVNALKLAGELLTVLPKEEWSPETTDKKQGFVHPVRMEGIAEKATIEFIIRDFDTANLLKYEERLKHFTETVVGCHPGAYFEMQVKEQYRNMYEILQHHPQVIEYAEEAYQRTGLVVRKEPIRGGTDGSRLSFMGLPCPNLFTGMQGIHSKKEWVGIKDMELAVEILVHLAQIWEEKTITQ